jgi:hypothetical protein
MSAKHKQHAERRLLRRILQLLAQGTPDAWLNDPVWDRIYALYKGLPRRTPPK